MKTTLHVAKLIPEPVRSACPIRTRELEADHVRQARAAFLVEASNGQTYAAELQVNRNEAFVGYKHDLCCSGHSETCIVCPMVRTKLRCGLLQLWSIAIADLKAKAKLRRNRCRKSVPDVPATYSRIENPPRGKTYLVLPLLSDEIDVLQPELYIRREPDECALEDRTDVAHDADVRGREPRFLSGPGSLDPQEEEGVQVRLVLHVAHEVNLPSLDTPQQVLELLALGDDGPHFSLSDTRATTCPTKARREDGMEEETPEFESGNRVDV